MDGPPLSQWQWEAFLTPSHLLSDFGQDSEASVVPAVGKVVSEMFPAGYSLYLGCLNVWEGKSH